MIRMIKGVLHPSVKNSVIIETSSGLGFQVFVPANSKVYKYAEGQEVRLFTSMIMRENEVSLYGFSDKENLDLFELLITVNGVGAKAGMAIMSALTPMELKVAIATGDAKAISKANGVGKKIAERLILELRDKIGTVELEGIVTEDVSVTMTGERDEAVAALMALGYTKIEATDAISKVKGDSLSCEEYIKNALKNLF